MSAVTRPKRFTSPRASSTGVGAAVAVVDEPSSRTLADGRLSWFDVEAHLPTLRIHWSRATATMIRQPMAKFSVILVQTRQAEPDAEDGHDQRTDQGAPEATPTAEQARAADHHGRDGFAG